MDQQDMNVQTPAPMSPSSKKSSMGMQLGIGAVVAVVIVALVMSRSKAASEQAMPTPAGDTSAPVEPINPAGDTSAPATAPVSAATYKDGTYTATGSYRSPAGPETIDVNLTLKDNVITAVTVKSNATNPMSVRFQGKFISGIQAAVVGKNINDVQLTNVSGSSLTPKGFADALAKIEAEAKA